MSAAGCHTLEIVTKREFGLMRWLQKSSEGTLNDDPSQQIEMVVDGKLRRLCEVLLLSPIAFSAPKVSAKAPPKLLLEEASPARPVLSPNGPACHVSAWLGVLSLITHSFTEEPFTTVNPSQYDGPNHCDRPSVRYHHLR